MTATMHIAPTVRTERRRRRRGDAGTSAFAAESLFGALAAPGVAAAEAAAVVPAVASSAALAAAPAVAPSPAPPEASAVASSPVVAPARAGAVLDDDAPAASMTLTLDDVLSHAWETLRAQVAATCLVCGGEVEPLGELPGGRCSGCGSVVE